jgi:hypothetical protein
MEIFRTNLKGKVNYVQDKFYIYKYEKFFQNEQTDPSL